MALHGSWIWSICAKTIVINSLYICTVRGAWLDQIKLAPHFPHLFSLYVGREVSVSG